jgi:oxygen-independent coproporphyrinogen III oxidase
MVPLNPSLPRSVYIHVPFCARRCSYCDFAVEAMREPPVEEWLGAVEHEMALLQHERGWQAPLEVDTLYLGGGTPSLLGPGAMGRLAALLQPYLRWDGGAVEWTCEANPESFTPELARDWRAAGVNRISLGAQTFHEPALRWMGRLHGTEGPARAMETARAAGFDNVSVDLIFALPGRLGRDWGADIERALALQPEHVSLYGLTAEPGAPLGRWVSEGRERLPDEDAYADEYLLAHERLTRAGFRHYEVSNFARGDRVSRHNFVYWTGEPYIALGPGAHGFYPPVRRWNLRSWNAYREAVLNRRLPIDGEEAVGADEAALERAWLLLRTDRGYPIAEATPSQLEAYREWVRFGWAITGGEVIRLTPEGWLLLDRLAVEFAVAGAAPPVVPGL